jgi:UDP-N-acetylglucosamine--N-acetylmuramyl-(pentapeptide) pyrophosphoryl-undecaprenol N-acetylglucosamine transferase
MTQHKASNPHVAIACGGTGGHVFPGIAVAEMLRDQGCTVTLLVSPKTVDQWAVTSESDLDVATIPAVALNRGELRAFLRGFWESYRAVRQLFKARRPQAMLAMGGFTSAPAVLAAKTVGAVTALHEANSIPGRANRWLAPWVDWALVNFPIAASRLRNASVQVTGMAVRAQFQRMDSASCRVMLGLQPQRPALLVMGGSQGASALNELLIHSLPILVRLVPELQYIHLTGSSDEAKVRAAYEAHQRKILVRPFLTEMELAMNAAVLAVSRAGASSLAELAALRLPAILIPYPAATDNHQFHNALALVETGAARMVSQNLATPETLAKLIADVLANNSARAAIQIALAQWHRPQAAEQIAACLVAAICERFADSPDFDLASLRPARPGLFGHESP